MNAVVDALSSFGVRHMDMPATPEKVWRAMNDGADANDAADTDAGNANGTN